MKYLLLLTSLLLIGSSGFADDEVELVCVRKQIAANICHYNFLINGMPYRYLDNGCRESRESALKKAREGKLALAKEWKLECPEKQ
ncbi:MAG: hypothetical protein N2044_07795 [Cyclobacteriaceae bacterium]|nr:hypothetical protein [Cyclobacteriaceae bacterium]MCX7637730.1 hypothetical protein [Cyclobacteriaceae bacterium]MDW8331014.1 hypothetical protein [Cyclobacteriaceae bacterium]